LSVSACLTVHCSRFCGITHGEKTREFFAKFVRLLYSSMYDRTARRFDRPQRLLT